MIQLRFLVPATLALLAPTIRADKPTIEVQLRDAVICETAVFTDGARLFTDREYAAANVPATLDGLLFLRTGIQGVRIRCVEAGELFALTPRPGRYAASQNKRLTDAGFVRIADVEPFQLFGDKPHDQAELFRKSVAKGDVLDFGKWIILLGFAAAKPPAGRVPTLPRADGERLHNRIVLPAEWPPKTTAPDNAAPRIPPYLDQPPPVIDIAVGRQLFVDRFLVEMTDLLHVYHLPEKYAANPVLSCETDLERQTNIVGGVARPCVWWNHEAGKFYMWYQAGTYFQGTLALATSTDGLRWSRPALDVNPGSNQALVPGFRPDSYSVVPDWDAADPRQRFKLFSTVPGWNAQTGFSFTSPDGVHWENKTETGKTYDRSSMFYNPFRKKWVYSLRSNWRGRTRSYWEHDDFLAGARWKDEDPVTWTGADAADPPEPGYLHTPELYNLDAVPYESLMLGFFEIHRGPENDICARRGLPKLNEITFGYSRDGFHWHRPDRRAHLPASRRDAWDRGFVESGGNICVVVGDRLFFYHSGSRGDLDGAIREDGTLNKNAMYDRNSIGVSTLRRDGFASFEAGASTGSLTTRPLTFSGRHLFVNAATPQGVLQAEVLDEDGNPIPPFTLGACIPFTGDSTLAPIRWEGGDDLSGLAGKTVRFRFALRRGNLYAFWVSRDASGRSDGYVAGGGPGHVGPIDTQGVNAPH